MMTDETVLEALIGEMITATVMITVEVAEAGMISDLAVDAMIDVMMIGE